MKSRQLGNAAAHAADAVAEQRGVTLDARQQPRQFGVWLTAESAAEYLDFTGCKHPARAFRAWADRQEGLRKRYRGDVPLWSRSELDAVINHGAHVTASRVPCGVGTSDKAVR